MVTARITIKETETCFCSAKYEATAPLLTSARIILQKTGTNKGHTKFAATQLVMNAGVLTSMRISLTKSVMPAVLDIAGTCDAAFF